MRVAGSAKLRPRKTEIMLADMPADSGKTSKLPDEVAANITAEDEATSVMPSMPSPIEQPRIIRCGLTHNLLNR
jgi:hypothetical protein